MTSTHRRHRPSPSNVAWRAEAQLWRVGGLLLLLALMVSLASCGSDAQEEEEEDCAQRCRESTGGPPVNDCLLVGDEPTCVYTCSVDGDCFDMFYSGCTATTDDGTPICAY